MSFVTTETSARTDTYPFTCQVPFGNYFIQSIKLALKDVQQQPSLNILTAKQGQCSITLMSGSVVLATVQYAGNLWMTFDTTHAFGFVKLRVRPSHTINFSGKLPLHPLTYTYSYNNKGITSIQANDDVKPVGDTLNITVLGSIQCDKDQLNFTNKGALGGPDWPFSIQRFDMAGNVVGQLGTLTITPVVKNSQLIANQYVGQNIWYGNTYGGVTHAYLPSADYMYIRRTQQPLYNFIQTPIESNQVVYTNTETGKYIQNINGTQTQRLNVISVCEQISVTGPVAVGDSVYVIYVSSNPGFPTCAQYDSDSQSSTGS